MEDKDFIEWQQICEEFCKQRGFELLFVNSDNFGFQDDKGNLIHMYAEELAEYLRNEVE